MDVPKGASVCAYTPLMYTNSYSAHHNDGHFASVITDAVQNTTDKL